MISERKRIIFDEAMSLLSKGALTEKDFEAMLKTTDVTEAERFLKGITDRHSSYN